MTSNECLLDIMKYVQANTARHIAYHNHTEHGGKQSMDFFNKRAKEARDRIAYSCVIDIDILIDNID